MSYRNPKSIREALRERDETFSMRRLVPASGGVDLCSNDYLGIARKLAKIQLSPSPDLEVLGATGSRLVSGSTHQHEELEHELAVFHGAPAALLFGSGYEANLGLLGSIGTRHDTILYDELVHASMRDGIRLSEARAYSFRHNDLDDLRKKIAQAKGELFIAVESVYSMDGDLAPLATLCELCEEVGAYLIVDEAHGTGVFGRHGEGVVQELGLEGRVFARVHTFGKALGYRGAVVVGDEELRHYLINFARPFIYSTAPDLLMLKYIREAYRLMRDADVERAALRALEQAVRGFQLEFPALRLLCSMSPIQGIIVPSNQAVLEVEGALKEAGYFAKAIRSPTVGQGLERMRICLHSFNTSEEIKGALAIISSVVERRCSNG